MFLEPKCVILDKNSERQMFGFVFLENYVFKTNECAFSERKWWVAFSKTLVFNINLTLLSHSFMFAIPKIPKQNCIMAIKINQILIPLLLSCHPLSPSFLPCCHLSLPSCFLAIAQPQLSLKVFHALNLLEIHEHVFNDLGKKLMGKASGTV